VAILVARNANEGLAKSAPGGSLESGGRLLSLHLEETATVAVKMFSHLIYFVKKYKFCIFNAIFNDNAATNYITVQHKKVHSRQL
jgi:hypothetical protein